MICLAKKAGKKEKPKGPLHIKDAIKEYICGIESLSILPPELAPDPCWILEKPDQIWLGAFKNGICVFSSPALAQKYIDSQEGILSGFRPCRYEWNDFVDLFNDFSGFVIIDYRGGDMTHYNLAPLLKK